MSTVRRRRALEKHFVKSMVTGDDIISDQMTCKRLLRETKIAMKSVLEILRK